MTELPVAAHRQLQDYVLNEAALDYLEERGADPSLVARLRTCEPRHFPDRLPYFVHLTQKASISSTTARSALSGKPVCGGRSAITAFSAIP